MITRPPFWTGSPMHRFLEVLSEGPLLFDGAVGTEFYRRGVYLTNNFEELNLTQPHLVRSVHEEYVKSGAQVITTNSYGANRLRLERFGLGDRAKEFNLAAARLAREAAGEAVWVAGSVGPSGAEGARILGPGAQEVRDAFSEQVDALIEGGVDLILLETFAHLVEIRLVLELIRQTHPGLPVIASMRFEPDRRLADGSEPEAVAAALADWGADVIGANCGQGPELVFNVAQRMLGAGPPVLAEPNAGSPEMVDGRTVYVGNPEFFGVYGRRMLKAGIRAVGGCCGTTPAHIHSMRGAVRMMSGGSGWQRRRVSVERVESRATIDRAPRVPLEERSALAQKLAAGRFVVSVEVNPPLGLDPSPAVAAARMLTEAGIDVVNTADGPRASVRMNNLAVAVAMQAAGAEVLLHVCCRDRNLLALQGDLLGAHALGIRNLVVITGDPPKVGDYPDATAVYDLDSIELIRWVDGFNHGIDPTGKRLDATTNFFIATGAEPGALDYDRELRRLERKVAAGADLVMTQPVFDPRTMERFLDDTADLGVPVLLGLLPFASARNAEFLHENVPGMNVPEEVRKRMAAAGSGERARATGVEIARENLLALRDRVQGAYIMPPLGHYEMAVSILDGIRR
jgi:methionine synthase I (cobalamin-dependent)/5,10-methylenetetrahydrofolate reductase